jgi:hypothetical protein
VCIFLLGKKRSKGPAQAKRRLWTNGARWRRFTRGNARAVALTP